MKRKLEISNALRIQAELLEETLIKRLEELKRICIEEAVCLIKIVKILVILLEVI